MSQSNERSWLWISKKRRHHRSWPPEATVRLEKATLGTGCGIVTSSSSSYQVELHRELTERTELKISVLPLISKNQGIFPLTISLCLDAL